MRFGQLEDLLAMYSEWLGLSLIPILDRLDRGQYITHFPINLLIRSMITNSSQDEVLGHHSKKNHHVVSRDLTYIQR